MNLIHSTKRYAGAYIDSAILIAIIAFLFSYFQPALFLIKNIPTGGDMASHYYPAKYLKEVLLPKGRIVGWLPGNYAGFPLFQVYFPFPFLLIALLSYLFPMQIAFKAVSVLGVFSLPLCAYFALRLMNYKFPIPILGALFTLPFLFMEANSMWGGNIPSTLAGEFSFSIGFSLSMLFLGTLYSGLAKKRGETINGVLLFFIGFNHAYTLLFSVLISAYFLITTKDFVYKLKYLLKVYTLAFLLISFWAIPLIANIAYTTNFNIVWRMDSFFEIIPAILIPFVVVSVLGSLAHLCLLIAKKDAPDNRLGFFWFGIVVSILFYFSAYKIGVVDIRFLPFMQLLFMIIAAASVYKGIQYLRQNWIIPIIVAPLVLLWVSEQVKFIPQWVAWNFSGFESKDFWPQFSGINQYLKGAENDPRVVYEHSPDHNAAGTPRAFESLPLFSGRSTLEGLYMQSTITSPFAFYMQSELSKVASAPLPDYTYTSLNLREGIKHLKMFNVKDFIVISDTVKSAIKQYPEFDLKASFPPYEIYELKTNSNHYVAPLAYEPVLCETTNWKRLFYEWFKDGSVNDVHLVLDSHTKGTQPFQYKIANDNFTDIPKVPIDIHDAYVREEVKNDEILIETNWINKPLLIKVSYHKNWKVEGAREIYHVSPSFMLIYPQSGRVRLFFGYGMADYVGYGLTFLGICIAGVSVCLKNKFYKVPVLSIILNGLHKTEHKFYTTGIFGFLSQNRLKFLAGALSVILVFFLSSIFMQNKDPQRLYNEGMKYFDKKKYTNAQRSFSNILNDHPFVSIADDANYYYAICFFKEENFLKTIEAFQSLIQRYKDSNWIPEAYYHVGLCKTKLGDVSGASSTYSYLVDNYGSTVWANYARDRLHELQK